VPDRRSSGRGGGAHRRRCRTARRWREDPAFEERCTQARAIYREVVVGEAYRRVTAPDATPVWYRGRQVAHIRRFSTAMLMRLLDRL
jgi:hypothetical protein